MSERTQKALLWWGLAFAAIYGAALLLLLDMVPPPSAKLSSAQIAHWYLIRHTKIRIGAVIASWTSAFMIPITIVIAAQMRRKEEKPYLWTMMTLAGGIMMSIFLVLPPLFWGVAAFTAHRTPQVTAVMHELGVLTLVTTDQYYVFMWVAIVVICLAPKAVKHSPFPRWFGYFTAWMLFMGEAGAIAFLPRSGPFAWNGIFVFWIPFGLFGVWMTIMCYQLFTNLTRQRLDAEASPRPAVAPTPEPAAT